MSGKTEPTKGNILAPGQLYEGTNVANNIKILRNRQVCVIGRTSPAQEVIDLTAGSEEERDQLPLVESAWVSQVLQAIENPDDDGDCLSIFADGNGTSLISDGDLPLEPENSLELSREMEGKRKKKRTGRKRMRGHKKGVVRQPRYKKKTNNSENI